MILQELLKLNEETKAREGWFIAKKDFKGQLSSYDSRPPKDDWIDEGSKVFATYTSQNTVEYSKTAKSSIIWTLSVKEFERNTEPFVKKSSK